MYQYFIFEFHVNSILFIFLKEVCFSRGNILYVHMQYSSSYEGVAKGDKLSKSFCLYVNSSYRRRSIKTIVRKYFM